MGWFKTHLRNLNVNASGATTGLEINSVDVTATAAAINAGTMGTTSTVAELDLLDAVPASVAISHAAGGAGVCNVTLTVKDAAGVAITKPTFVRFWLSDAATGAGLTSHAADSFAATTGQVMHAEAAGQSEIVQTDATGVAVIALTDSHKTAYYVCASLGFDGYADLHLLAGGDYGA